MMAGWAGLFAVNVLASDLKLQAVSRASQGRRQESIICAIHPGCALWGWGFMGDGLSPILVWYCTTRPPIARGGDVNEAGRDWQQGKLLLEECLGNGDATITMAVNALTIVQGTMQLEVPLLEDEG